MTIDVEEHFVKATYFLEGDGPLVLSCYKKLKAVAETCQPAYFPNVRAAAAAITNEDPNQNLAALQRRTKACVQPRIQYFLRKFNIDLLDAVDAFKQRGYVMCTVTVSWLRPTQLTQKPTGSFHSLKVTQPSIPLLESYHSTWLLSKMWSLNLRKEN